MKMNCTRPILFGLVCRWSDLPSTCVLLAAVVTTCIAQNAAAATGSKRRILYNSDGWNIFANYARPGEPVDRQVLRRRVTEVAGTQVDTFVLCVNAGLVYYPGGPVPMYGDRGHHTAHMKGCSANVGKNLRSLVSQGIDPIRFLVEAIKQEGMECVLSYRMNDVHHTEKDTPLMPEFWNKNRKWHTDRKAWSGGGLDYAVPEVRAHMLERLCDVLDRYGDRMDGLELDWMRFPRHFNPGQEQAGTEILTQFMRNVRRAVQAASKRHGRPLLLFARVWHRPDFCKRDGMDPFTWAKEGLIDFLTISRFLRNGEGTPDVEAYKSRITNIPIYGSIEVSTHNVWPANAAERKIYDAQVRPLLRMTGDDYRNEALNLWKARSDGVYLFNFFCTREYGIEPNWRLLKELGSPKTIKPPRTPLKYCGSVAELLKQASRIEQNVVSRNDKLHESWPDLAIAANGDLVVAYQESDSHGGGPVSTIVTRTSSDHGRTWSERTVVAELTNRRRDGWLNCSRILRLKDKSLLLAVDCIPQNPPPGVHGRWTNNNAVIWLYRSRDNGRTWAGPEKTSIKNGIVPSVAQLRDGTLLIGITRFDPQDKWRQYQLAYRSTDNGKTWSGPVTVAKHAKRQPNEGDFVELETGEVVCYMRDDEPGVRNGLKAISRDGGRTWGPLCGSGPWIYAGRPDVGLLSSGHVMLTTRVGPPQPGHCFGVYLETQKMALLPTPLDGPMTAGALATIIDDDKHPTRPDWGYSGWVELPDGSVYAAQYITTAEAPANRPFIRGYRIPQAFLRTTQRK